MSHSNDSDTELPLIPSKINVYHSAVAGFYAPSDQSGTRGMKKERIRSTPSWYGAERRDCVLATINDSKQGFQALIRHRDPIAAINALWGDPAFANELVYRPSKMFCNANQTEDERMVSEMWTGGFWNAAQHKIPVGSTIAPVIIASDKTQLTNFSGSKAAYPVYLTLGNIPKGLRRKPGARACVLLAYLSVDKPAKNGLSKTVLKLRNYELFHCSMTMVLDPLKMAGDPGGKGVEMVGGDGAVWRVYPLLATYTVADCDPKQCLVTCTKYGTCPKCRVSAWELEIPSASLPRTQAWTHQIIDNVWEEMRIRGKGGKAAHKQTMEDDVAGGDYEPFWVGFPLTDIHRCIAPDVLHQLFQGVFNLKTNVMSLLTRIQYGVDPYSECPYTGFPYSRHAAISTYVQQ
ncbi:hypothetical protein D9757_007829 [Collybiopsis confluens]|uniref:Uncharacterized protein n=1 Tax=Collybiopsis confluens TaxID=2823264 RepID=A0A8H5HQ89_9AGAR|nr:hypothetical protein D9757_007829 [Collybiopsis confluens]